MQLDVQRIRRDFPIFDQEVQGKPLIYLDSAATSQKPSSVVEALRHFYEKDNSNVHRGVHTLAERATAAYEAAREKVAGFIDAPAPETIIWTRGTTEGVNLVAYSWARRNIQPGEKILATVMEHHSNLVPWQLAARDIGATLEFVPVRDDFTLDMDRFHKLLDEKTRLVAVTHMSNVLGTINPVAEITRAAHAVGAKVLVDAAQSVAHMPVSVINLDCDFLVFSGHKMMGPTGVGVLYGKKELLNEMEPFHGGGEMINEVTLEGSTYKPAPYRFEAGTPPIAEAVGLGAAIDYLQDLGMENVQAYEEELTGYSLEVLSRIPGLSIHGPRTDRGGMVSFDVDGIHAHDLATILDSEGVAIRAGHHCAQPLMGWLGVPATARASFYVYNTPEEVDVLALAIEKAKHIFGIANQPA